ncbi:MAG: Asp23/Gls24 family envelope stress response protein [Peptoniphilaceae bacterium]|nr:Asp23/Gls24 family envelope stress response protein [Peptoniphilaceae bacterium]MDY6085298.1 Asp23/Gls24 family envelope stress response protein [Peptoniphilaceae bacterium]
MKKFNGGRCFVAARVIDQIIATAAAQVEGVAELHGFDRESGELRHNYEKSIVTETDGANLMTSLVVAVVPGYAIINVVKAVQEAVQQDVKVMLGLDVRGVDVAVV